LICVSIYGSEPGLATDPVHHAGQSTPVTMASSEIISNRLKKLKIRRTVVQRGELRIVDMSIRRNALRVR